MQKREQRTRSMEQKLGTQKIEYNVLCREHANASKHAATVLPVLLAHYAHLGLSEDAAYAAIFDTASPHKTATRKSRDADIDLFKKVLIQQEA